MGKKELIEEGKAYLGIEFGSTRIKAVACDEAGEVLAIGGFGWENSCTDILLLILRTIFLFLSEHGETQLQEKQQRFLPKNSITTSLKDGAFHIFIRQC